MMTGRGLCKTPKALDHLPAQEGLKTAMPTWRVSENRISECQLWLVALVILVWAMAGASTPLVDKLPEGLGTSHTALVDAPYEWSSADSNPVDTAGFGLLPIGHADAQRPALGFINPPARLVSYPHLPQGPPRFT